MNYTQQPDVSQQSGKGGRWVPDGQISQNNLSFQMQRLSRSCLPHISVGRGSVFGSSNQALKEDPINLSSEPGLANQNSNNDANLDQSSVSNDLELFRNVSLAKKLTIDQEIKEDASSRQVGDFAMKTENFDQSNPLQSTLERQLELNLPTIAQKSSDQLINKKQPIVKKEATNYFRKHHASLGRQGKPAVTNTDFDQTQKANKQNVIVQQSVARLPASLSKSRTRQNMREQQSQMQHHDQIFNCIQASKIQRNKKQLTPLEHTPTLLKNSKENLHENAQLIDPELVQALELLSENSGQTKRPVGPSNTDTEQVDPVKSVNANTYGDRTPKTPQSGQRRVHMRSNDGDDSASRNASFHGERKSVSNIKSNKRHDKSSPSKIADRANSLTTPAQNMRVTRQYEGTITCQSWNAEPFYRRAAKKLGWVQIPQQKDSKRNFQIRFNIGDLEGAAADLRPNQFYNHFPCNRELTTKAGLCRNLWFNCFEESQLKISHIFPRCYDLSDMKQVDQFISDFNQTAILTILKIAAADIQENCDYIRDLAQEYSKKVQYENPRNAFIRKFQLKCHQIDKRRIEAMGGGCLPGNDMVRSAYQFAKQLMKQYEFQDACRPRANRSCLYPLVITDELMHQLVQYQQRIACTGLSNDQQFTTYEQFKIVRLHQKFLDTQAQYRQIDGSRNIWIVKPSYNARGVGIYCASKLSQILPDIKQPQQKVVQKYIERPFCLSLGKVQKRTKFDFRQWVFVGGWEPLDVCVFSASYLKLCGSAFDLNHISDIYRHLSNYSLQKKATEDSEQSQNDFVMSSEQFEQYMRETQPGCEDFTWEFSMLPKIKDIVWRTLKAVQETQETKSNCFEVYGFDIVLDEDLQPWVIEVNLSPACEERAPWLTEMLDNSSIDLLSYLESKIITQYPSEIWDDERQRKREYVIQHPHKTTKLLNPKYFYEENNIKNTWVRLDESIREIREYVRGQMVDNPNFSNKGIQLEVVGGKANTRYEKKLDAGYKRDQQASCIQRVYRGHRARLIFRHKLHTKNAIIIQKNVRVFLAKLMLLRLRQERASIVIQRQLRGLIAKRLLANMVAAETLRQKTCLVIKLQTIFRIKRDRQVLQTLRTNHCATIIQCCFRGYVAKKTAQQLRKNRCRLIFLQRFYRARFVVRKSKAIRLQCILRTYMVRKVAMKNLKISRASSSLERLIENHSKVRIIEILRGLVRIAKIIKIQSHWRMITERQKYQNVLKQMAKNSISKLFQRWLFNKIAVQMSELKATRERQAIYIQRHVRGWFGRRQAKRKKRQVQIDKSAVVVQRYMRGLLATMKVREMKIQIGAAIMIQSAFRGFAARKQSKQQSTKNGTLEKKRPSSRTMRTMKQAQKYIRDNLQPKELKYKQMSPRDNKKTNLIHVNHLKSSRKQSLDTLPKLPDNQVQRRIVWDKSRELNNIQRPFDDHRHGFAAKNFNSQSTVAMKPFIAEQASQHYVSMQKQSREGNKRRKLVKKKYQSNDRMLTKERNPEKKSLKALHEQLIENFSKKELMIQDVLQHSALKPQNKVLKQSNTRIKVIEQPNINHAPVKVDQTRDNNAIDESVVPKQEEMDKETRREFINQSSMDDLEKAVQDLHQVSNQLRNSGLFTRQSEQVDQEQFEDIESNERDQRGLSGLTEEWNEYQIRKAQHRNVQKQSSNQRPDSSTNLSRPTTEMTEQTVVKTKNTRKKSKKATQHERCNNDAEASSSSQKQQTFQKQEGSIFEQTLGATKCSSRTALQSREQAVTETFDSTAKSHLEKLKALEAVTKNFTSKNKTDGQKMPKRQSDFMKVYKNSGKQVTEGGYVPEQPKTKNIIKYLNEVLGQQSRQPVVGHQALRVSQTDFNSTQPQSPGTENQKFLHKANKVVYQEEKLSPKNSLFKPVLQDSTARSPRNSDVRQMTGNFMPGVETEAQKPQAPFRPQNRGQGQAMADESKTVNKSEFSINYERTQKEIKEQCFVKRQAYDLATAVLRSPATFSFGPRKKRPERALQEHNNGAAADGATGRDTGSAGQDKDGKFFYGRNNSQNPVKKESDKQSFDYKEATRRKSQKNFYRQTGNAKHSAVTGHIVII